MTEKEMFLEKSESENRTQEMTDSRSRMVVDKRKSTNRVAGPISKTEYCSSPFSNSNEPNLEWTTQRMDTHQVNISNTLEKRIDVLGLETTCKLTKSMIANFRVVNQVGNKCIVFVANDTICLLDQHAGDESVRFERHQVDLAIEKKSSDAFKKIMKAHLSNALFSSELKYEVILHIKKCRLH